MRNSQRNLRAIRERTGRVHVAAEQAQVGRACGDMPFGLHIGQFDACNERIAGGAVEFRMNGITTSLLPILSPAGHSFIGYTLCRFPSSESALIVSSFEPPVAKHSRNMAFIGRLIFRYFPTVCSRGRYEKASTRQPVRLAQITRNALDVSRTLAARNSSSGNGTAARGLRVAVCAHFVTPAPVCCK
jgi:hypothetical protein